MVVVWVLARFFSSSIEVESVAGFQRWAESACVVELVLWVESAWVAKSVWVTESMVGF